MKTTLDMYFRQLWVDPRLEYASNTTLSEEKIIGDAEMAEKIWKPDTFFVNEVSSESKQVLLRIKQGSLKVVISVYPYLQKTPNFSRFYKKLGPLYKKLRCDKFGN